MVLYEVTATVQAGLVETYERYIRDRHIPDVLATGCFLGAVLARVGSGRYRTQYQALSQAALDRYLSEHAPRLRADLLSHFPQGVDLAREVWVTVQQWGSEDAGTS